MRYCEDDMRVKELIKRLKEYLRRAEGIGEILRGDYES
jgi:hypothetical protein